MVYENFIVSAIICGLISLVLIILTFWGFRTKIEQEKTSVYECGNTPDGSPTDSVFYTGTVGIVICRDIGITPQNNQKIKKWY